MSTKRIIALVGRRDEPTDGVWDYCSWLGASLGDDGYQFEIIRVNWSDLGWQAALAELKEKAKSWRGCWVLLQYTTLAWSRRGFPWRAPDVLSIIQETGVHCGVVFHDFGPFIAKGLFGAARKICHLQVLKRLYQLAERAIFTVPIEKVAWLPRLHQKAVHIPVGANCPEPNFDYSARSSETVTVAVYCLETDHRMAQEVSDIGYAVKQVTSVANTIRLVVLGRGSCQADTALRAEFSGTDVDLNTVGLVSPEEVSRILGHSDVLLFVRGHISSRRGSAIAGIACGLPVVAYEGPETGWPLTEAGLLLVPQRDREGLATALKKVLSNADFRSVLRERSRRAQLQYFSWSAIAACLVKVLRDPVSFSNADIVGEKHPLHPQDPLNAKVKYES